MEQNQDGLEYSSEDEKKKGGDRADNLQKLKVTHQPKVPLSPALLTPDNLFFQQIKNF